MPKNSQESGSEEITSPSGTQEQCNELRKQWFGLCDRREQGLALAQAEGLDAEENSQQQGRQEFVQVVSSPQDRTKNSQESGSEEITSPSDIEELCDQLRGQWFILCDRMLAEGKEPMSFTR